MNLKLLVMLFFALSVAACHGNSDPASTEQHAEVEPGEAGNGHVTLSAEQIAASGISLETAGAASIRETLPVYGVIAPNAERVREVAARFPGVVREISRKIGDAVKKGDRLATVESNESLQTYALVAPLDGVVIVRNANPGEQSGDKVLFTVADLSSVWVELSLFPRDVGKVKVAQSVRVTSADTGIAGEGKLVYVAPFGSTANQTLTARVLLDNKQRQWSPGLYVTAHITLGETRVPLAVRSVALQTLEDKNVVFVQGEDGFEPRPVSTGRTDGEWIEIASGLKSGETYAAANSFILKAELGKGSAGHAD
jgi:membrane fusion protein, heavy metal efflux system